MNDSALYNKVVKWFHILTSIGFLLIFILLLVSKNDLLFNVTCSIILIANIVINIILAIQRDKAEYIKKTYFGDKLKEIRIKKARIGCRNFADKMRMNAADYLKMEQSREPFPRDIEWIKLLLDNLGIAGTEDAEILKLLWLKPFKMKKMSTGFVPVLVGKDEPMGEDEIRSLQSYLNDIAEEHNKKAEEHNKCLEKI